MSTRRRSTIAALVLAAVAAALPHAVHAQQGNRRQPPAPSISVTPSSQRIEIGQQVSIQVNVTGSAANAARPRLTGPERTDDYTLEFAGTAVSSGGGVVIINNQRIDLGGDDRTTYTYRLVAHRAGEFTLPAFEITVDGTTLRTDPIRFTAAEPPRARDASLTASLETTDAFVGQPLRLRFTWLVAPPVSVTFTPPPIDGFDLVPAPDPRPPATPANDPRFVRLPFLGETITGSYEDMVIDGRPMGLVTFERIVIPRRPGELVIGPFTAVMESGDDRRSLGMLDVFGSRTQRTRTSAVSEPIRLRVNPLPPNPPPGFSGLVGAYSIETHADASEVNVGDPIDLAVRIRGPAPLSLVPPLTLDDQPRFAAAFRVPSGQLLPQSIDTPGRSPGVDGVAVFSAVIRARNDAVSEIPPVVLVYFDPREGDYITARSESIPLTVRPTRQITLDPPATAQRAQASPPPRPAPDVPALPAELKIGCEELDLASVLREPAVLVAITAPPAVFAACAVFAARRRALQKSRRSRALRTATALLRKPPAGSPTPQVVSAALRGYAADMFDLPSGGITNDEAARLLTSGAGPAAEPLAALLRECDAAVYAQATSAANGESLRTRALSCLPAAHRALSRSASSVIPAEPHA